MGIWHGCSGRRDFGHHHLPRWPGDRVLAVTSQRVLLCCCTLLCTSPCRAKQRKPPLTDRQFPPSRFLNSGEAVAIAHESPSPPLWDRIQAQQILMGLAQHLAAVFFFLLLGECPAQWQELSWKCCGESRAWGAQSPWEEMHQHVLLLHGVFTPK